MRGIHQWPVDSHHKGPVTRKHISFDDVIMKWASVNPDLCRHTPLVINRLMSQVWYVFLVSYHLWLIPMKHSPSALLGVYDERVLTWWRHQMETLSALLVICVGNSPATGKFASQRPVTRSFDVFFDLCLNKRLSKQSRGLVLWDAIVLMMTSL